MRQGTGTWRQATALLLTLLALLLTGCARRGQAATPAWDGVLRISAPPLAHAGETVSVLVEGAAPDGAEVTLTVMLGYGPHVYRAQMIRGAAALAIPAADTREAGAATLVAGVGAARASTSLNIVAGPTTTLSEPLVGPRSICVGELDHSLAAVIASDQYDNAPADGTGLTLHLSYPDGSLAALELRTRGGMAWAPLVGHRRAGTVAVGATSGGAHSSDADMSVAACVPTPFSLRAVPPGLPADGRQILTLRTSPITDSYANPLPDGTLITFLVAAPSGELRIPAQTIGGVAEVTLRAPQEPGTASVRAIILGVESAPLEIVFSSMGGLAPLHR
ncbi:MAG: hypothetical protein WCJ55_02570 [Chloroflexales bacterium]